MACSLFHFALISAYLVILNQDGFPATNMLYLPMLRAVPQVTSISLNISENLSFRRALLLHIKHASHLISSTFRSHLLFSDEQEREKKYQPSAKAVNKQYKSSLDFSSYELKALKKQMLTPSRHWQVRHITLVNAKQEASSEKAVNKKYGAAA